MNFQQLEYIIALNKHRHFVKASEECFVSQPTLSTMVQKLEEEIGTKIFNRSTTPISLTPIGEKIIVQAQKILLETSKIKEITLEEKQGITGQLQIGIIPTVAPYLVPGFLKSFLTEYNQICLQVNELRTSVILEKLKNSELSMAILATPLKIEHLLEIPIYYEKFWAYVSPKEEMYNKSELCPSELTLENLWVLEEGHCLRQQVFNFCGKVHNQASEIYQAGSLDTLVKIIDKNGGYTIIPELHIPTLSEQQKKHLRPINSPEVVREISIVIREDYSRQKLLNCVVDVIKSIIPESMLDSRLKKFAVKL